MFFFSLAACLFLSFSPFGATSPNGESTKIGEEADLKYRALKMVLSADDPNILYIEKHFSVNRDENVIDYVKNRVAAYEDSVLKYNEMVRMAAYKDSVANELCRESNSIKRTIKNYQ